MKIDITLKITPKMIKDAQGNEKKALVGHLGTHFDVMNKEFPLDYTERKGIVFDVSHVQERDIEERDIDISQVEKGMFVAFYTGFIENVGYRQLGLTIEEIKEIYNGTDKKKILISKIKMLENQKKDIEARLSIINHILKNDEMSY